MEIKKTDRATLKTYFIKNAMPTASQFAELIDAPLNQKDDGVAKPAGEPLSLQAEGDDKRVLAFYRSFSEANPAWTLSLNPGADAARPDAGKPGWSLGVGDGPSRFFIDQNSGRVGIGTTSPRSALDTGSGVMSGAANDYQKAQFSLSGGGTVTWGGPDGYLKWTARFIAISAEKPKTFADGYVDIALPTSAALVTAWDGSSRVDAAKGIQLKRWEALYAVHDTGGRYTQVKYQIVSYAATVEFHAPGNWLLVAVVNQDDESLKLGTGVTLAKGATYVAAQGSGLPRGAIIMWTGDTAPAGWALCDGQNGTPDLRGRFVLGMGTGKGLTQRSRDQTGGVEKHRLTLDEMPSHNHEISDPGHFHNWTATRQQAGTDDNNNTSEFSRGDKSSRDDVSKDTNAKTTGIAVKAAGGGAAHENMPPFYVLAYLMKL